MSLWRNQDQNENQGAHEIEILHTIKSTAEARSKTSSKMALADLAAMAQRRNPSKVAPACFHALCKLYIGPLEDNASDLVEEPVGFHSANVGPKEVTIGTSCFVTITSEEALNKCPCLRLQLILTQ